ncbi:MAG TPA: carboxypeptidase-like regulatory domain-containing protein, partial [Candidatus Acidoferrum sp.]|nr:carboxypeptidase-like regulatory domain-containing protein [Candidatus Acidoferrum sp.]
MNLLLSPRSRARVIAVALTLLGSARANASQQQTQQQPISPGTVSGHVFRSDSGAPLPKATVTLSISGQNNPNSQILPQIVRTDSSGAFQFTQVTPGKYTARAEHNGFVPAGYGQNVEKQLPPTSFNVGPGQNLNKIDITLGAAGIISGTITDGDNDPAEGIQVSAIALRYARGGARQELQMRTVTTDDQGNYRLFGLVPGFYFVRVFSPLAIGANLNTGTSFAPTYYPGTTQVEGAQRIQVAPGAETSGIRFSLNSQLTHRITGNVNDGAGGSESRRFITQLSRISPDGSNTGMTVQMGNVSNSDGSFAFNAVTSG